MRRIFSRAFERTAAGIERALWEKLKRSDLARKIVRTGVLVGIDEVTFETNLHDHVASPYAPLCLIYLDLSVE